MKKLLTTITLSALVGTSASNLKPVFTNNVVNHGFKSNQSNNKEITIQGENSGNPFINKIKTIDIDANISSSVISSDGIIYVGTYNHGLYNSTDGINFQSVKGIPSDVASVTTLGKIVYIGTQKNGLWKSDNGIDFVKTPFGGLYISTIAISSVGTIYVENLGDLFKSTDGINFVHIKQFDGAIYSIHINKGNIWIGTTKGLYKSNNGTDFENITNGISKDVNIRVVNFDIKNIIWVGTKQGLYKSIDGIKFKLVDLKTEVNNEIRSIATNSKLVLLGLDNGIIYKSVDGIKFEKIKQMDAYIQVNVTFDGTIYIGTEKNGLWIINSLIKINNFNYFGDKYNGSVYNSVQKIDIKENLVANATLDGKTITIPTTDLDIPIGEHNLILTLKDKSFASIFGGDVTTGQVTYKLWVKTSIDKKNIQYSTNVDDTDLTDLSLGFISNSGNTNNCPIIETKSKDGTGTHDSSLIMNFNDKLIDFDNSFYVQGTVDESTNDFTQTGIHQKFSKNLLIQTDGIYHLHLVDTVGNNYDSYLELGKNNWKLKGIFNDDTLNTLKNKLNVNVNLTDPKQLAQATGWLTNYDKFASNLFVKFLQENGKGFDQDIRKDLENNFKWFLKSLTYETNNEPKFDDGLDKTALVKTITDKANEILKIGLNVLPKNLNVDTKNVVNKSTLDSYSIWIKGYDTFINNNKDKWINDITKIASRGFATTEQENQIKEKIRNLLDNSNIKNYLKNIVWEDNKLLKVTSNDYQQYIELDKLQTDTINWVNTNMKDINTSYQQAIKNAESELNLHGYSIDTLLNGKQKPQTKSEIDNFADGQNYHDWLQTQANIKFRGWQLAIGFGVSIPLLLLVVAVAWVIRSRTNPKYRGYWRGRKFDNDKKKENKLSMKKNIKKEN